MSKNKQTWKESKQSVVESKWANVRYKDALLNTGIEVPENNWRPSGIPVRWASDSSYKKPKKGIVLTYSFIHKKSKFNYKDDRGKIKPAASFSSKQQKDIGKIFKSLSSYINVKFVKVRDKNTVGTIRIGFRAITDEQGNWLPNIYATADTPKSETRGGDIWFNKNFTRDNFRLGLVEGQPVTPSLVMLHEIMHALGLEHPYDNPKRPAPGWARNMEHTLLADEHLDNQGFVRAGRSYGVSSTPMMWDIAGLQHLYGANMETNKGRTIHKFSNKQPFFKTVWDSSGNDTFDFSNFGRNLKINLVSGNLSKISFDVADDRWSNKEWGNLGIAYGSVIENCVGGTANDVITGNSVANKINGMKGNDLIFGNGGNDLLIGGGGKDRVWGQGGRDTFRIQRGTGYTIIKDFRNGQDKIHLGSDRSELNLQTRGDDVHVYLKKDLMAIVDNAAGDLQRRGNYLV